MRHKSIQMLLQTLGPAISWGGWRNWTLFM